MSFGIYIVGYLILIIGLAIGANMLHVPPKWIGVGILCMVGVAIIHGVTATRLLRSGLSDISIGAKRAINFLTIDLFFFKIAKKKIHIR